MANNPEISKVTLPNGVTYDIKDTVAREAIKAGIDIEVVDTLPAPSADTKGKWYFIKHEPDVNDIYDEYITIGDGTEDNPYSWEKIGNTQVDLTNYSKKTHTHTVTPNITLTGASYTPVGEITNANFTGTEENVSVSGTADGTVSAPNISIKNAGGDTMTLYSMSGEGSYTPSAYTPETYKVTNETLIFTQSSYTKEDITLPSRTQANISASAPTFTGKEITSTGKFTPSGNVSATFEGTAATITPTLNNGQTMITTSQASE